MDTEDYGHLLLATDFEPESEPVVARALRLRTLFEARLTLLHVVEYVPPSMDYMPVGYSGDPLIGGEAGLEAELLRVAEQEMTALGERLEVPAADRLVRVGATGQVIDEVAAELEVDLVVIGSHGRHGLLGLFGATARQVLRNPDCDVLCVKLGRN
ncbi:universal stress protein [Marichromatium bheemlicum]|uniref:Universal stress protein n=1 Tax=Marichromatium bheemlicum TaxID=365339 RepID=A0ABX1I3R7_9GAMM|nr:universal stress protein [Marichromatium bheemlicum]NKN31718.1 universal stress protein [Marichromatium bheemlicum]